VGEKEETGLAMRPNNNRLIYRRSSVVCLSVCRSMSMQKTAEPIEMPFGILTRVGPWKHQ